MGGTDTYSIVALVGTVLFVVKTIMLFVGGDGDSSIDGAGHHDAGFDTSLNFTVLSVQSVLAFLMGFGLMGLVAREEWGLTPLPTLFSALGFGIGLMVMVSWLFLRLKSLSSSGNIDYASTVGVKGRVYTTIVENGMGQVELNVSGRRMVLAARARGGVKIPSFDDVIVEEVSSMGVLEVRPVVSSEAKKE